jgi:hypothetical protein
MLLTAAAAAVAAAAAAAAAAAGGAEESGRGGQLSRSGELSMQAMPPSVGKGRGDSGGGGGSRRVRGGGGRSDRSELSESLLGSVEDEEGGAGDVGEDGVGGEREGGREGAGSGARTCCQGLRAWVRIVRRLGLKPLVYAALSY